MLPVRRLAVAGILLASLAALAAPAAGAQDGSGRPLARSIELSGTVDPATASWLSDQLEEAAGDGARLAIVRLDTPGGLDTSMREMVRAIRGAAMPVVVHVTPDGARAASAGLFVALAADVAAMAPGTNIGAATPVTLSGSDIGDDLGRKIRNDAAAYARALAEARDRNADLAERMVREGVSVSAEAARTRGLVEVIARDEARLLAAVDGMDPPGPRGTLQTDGLRVEHRDMPFGVQARQVLVNPTVAFLLLLAGIALLAVEATSPGLVGPGAFGAVSLLLGLYGTFQLPVTAGGVALLVLGIVLLVAETQVSGGLLGAGGVAALVGGGLLLFDTDSEALALSVPAALTAGLVLGGFLLLIANRAVAARHRPASGGPEDLVGRRAEVRVALDPEGQVYVEGALWRAVTAGPTPLGPGTPVIVEAVHGLTLEVRPQPQREPPSSPTPSPPP